LRLENACGFPVPGPEFSCVLEFGPETNVYKLGLDERVKESGDVAAAAGGLCKPAARAVLLLTRGH